MYIITKLKKLFPHYEKDLNDFDNFLKKCSKNPTDIFTDDKNNFHWLVCAYLYGPGKGKYSKCMAMYEMSVNLDIDYMREQIEDIDTTNMSLDDMRKYLFKNSYDIEYEHKIRKKCNLDWNGVKKIK